MQVQRAVEMRDVGRGQNSGFAQLPALIARLNGMSQGLTYSMNGNRLACEVREGGTLSNFDAQMQGFIGSAPVIPLRLTNARGLQVTSPSGAPIRNRAAVDYWETGYADMDDLLSMDDLALQFVLVHFLRERSATRNYARRMGTPSLDVTQPASQAEFLRAHALGIQAELAVMQDFFQDPGLAIVPGGEVGPNLRQFRNRRRNYLVRVRIRVTRAPGGGVIDTPIIRVVRDGVVHTPEDFRRILSAEMAAERAPAPAGAPAGAAEAPAAAGP
jgi:hypothetical protein